MNGCCRTNTKSAPLAHGFRATEHAITYGSKNRQTIKPKARSILFHRQIMRTYTVCTVYTQPHKINHYPEKCFNHRRIDPCALEDWCAVPWLHSNNLSMECVYSQSNNR